MATSMKAGHAFSAITDAAKALLSEASRIDKTALASNEIEDVCTRLEAAVDQVRGAKTILRDWKSEVRELERATARSVRRAADPNGGTCTIVFGGETFTVPEGADVETRKGVLLVNGAKVAIKWPGASISMVGGTFGNVTLC